MSLADGKWRPLDQAFITQMWRVYLTDPVLFACRNVVCNNLLSGGVMYTDNQYKQIQSQHFFDHIQTNYPRLCRDIIDSVIVQVRKVEIKL
jgi:hypothetical protein